MVRITIDGQLAQVPAGTTIMEAAKAVKCKIPHLCYLKGINEIPAAVSAVWKLRASARWLQPAATL